jgi:hypothetical protein
MRFMWWVKMLNKAWVTRGKPSEDSYVYFKIDKVSVMDPEPEP